MKVRAALCPARASRALAAVAACGSKRARQTAAARARPGGADAMTARHAAEIRQPRAGTAAQVPVSMWGADVRTALAVAADPAALVSWRLMRSWRPARNRAAYRP